MIDPQNDQLPVGLIAQLVEHCTGIAEVKVRIPIQEWIFQAFVAAALAALKARLQGRKLGPDTCKKRYGPHNFSLFTRITIYHRSDKKWAKD